MNQKGEFVLSDNWDKSLTFECTPDDGMVGVWVWWLNANENFVFNVKAEVIKKAAENKPELEPNEVFVQANDIKLKVEEKDENGNPAYYDHFIYQLKNISGHKGIQPSAVRFILTGENAYGANLRSDKGYISWIGNEEKYSLKAGAASEYLEFVVNSGVTIQYMIFDYSPLPPMEPEEPEKPEEPELGPEEAVVSATKTETAEGDGGKKYDHYTYQLSEIKGHENQLPCGVRFTLSGQNAWGANLQSDKGYIGWVGNESKHYLKPGDAEQYLEFVVDAGIKIEHMIFDYSPIPELEENEAFAQAGDNAKYFYKDVKGHETEAPSGVRCFFSGGETIEGWADDTAPQARTRAAARKLGTLKSGEVLSFERLETETNVFFVAGDGVEIQYVIFQYTKEEPEEPEEPVLKDNEAFGKESSSAYNYLFSDVEGHEGDIPTAVRCIFSGADNMNVNGLDSNGGYKEYFTNLGSGTDVSLADKEYGGLYFDVQEGTTLEYVIFTYGASQEAPTLKDNEAYGKEGGSANNYLFKDVEGHESDIPTAVRCIFSGANNMNVNGLDSNGGYKEYFTNLGNDTDVSLADKEYGGLYFDVQEGTTLEHVIFTYGSASTASLFSRIAARALRGNRNPKGLLEETGELLAVPDTEGNYYLPELSDDCSAIPMEICGESDSNIKNVKFLFPDGREEPPILAGKKAYYFFREGEADTFESVSFEGQDVKNITILYWNGEKGEAAEKEGEFALPDYRIPAAMAYYGGAEEGGKAEVKLMAQVYDKETETWKEEGETLVKKLAVGSDEANWYVFTKRDKETLKRAFEKAKAGGMAPRLMLQSLDSGCFVESLTLYYDTPYTDDMEITGPEKEQVPEVKDEEKEGQKPDSGKPEDEFGKESRDPDDTQKNETLKPEETNPEDKKDHQTDAEEDSSGDKDSKADVEEDGSGDKDSKADVEEDGSGDKDSKTDVEEDSSGNQDSKADVEEDSSGNKDSKTDAEGGSSGNSEGKDGGNDSDVTPEAPREESKAPDKKESPEAGKGENTGTENSSKDDGSISGGQSQPNDSQTADGELSPRPAGEIHG